MPTLSQRLELLGKLPSETAGEVLLAAIPTAAPDERNALAIAAVGTGSRRAVDSVLRDLPTFGPGVADAAVSGGPAVSAALLTLLDPSRPDAARAALDLVARRGEIESASGIAGLLDGPRELADHASRVLLSLAMDAVGPNGRRRLAPAASASLDAVLARIMGRDGPRHRPEVLLAVALLARRPGPALEAWLADSEHPGHFALRSIPGHLDRAEVRRNLLNWLDCPQLAPAVIRRLPEVRGPQAWADVLDSAHLLRTPDRRRALGHAGRSIRWLPDLLTTLSLPEAAQRRLPSLIRVLPVSRERRLVALADLVPLADPMARTLTLQAILELAGPSSHEAITRFAFDGFEPIARIAAGRVLRRTSDPAVLAELARTAPPPVARAAVARLAREDTARLFEYWLELPPLDLVAAAHRRLIADRPRMIAGLARTLSDRDRAKRLRAISVARRLRIVPAVELDLILMAGDDDHHVASAAVAALADASSDSAHETLRAAVQHDDGRVRANAVEALDRRGCGRDVDRLRPLAVGSHPRTRANAVRAMLRHRPAEGQAFLRSILRDSDPAQRLSGLWVARRSGPEHALAEVQLLAASDPHPTVRRRASQAAGLLALRSPRCEQKERIA